MTVEFQFHSEEKLFEYQLLFQRTAPPPATEKVANEVNFQEFCLQISSAHLPLQNNFVFLLKFRFHCFFNAFVDVTHME